MARLQGKKTRGRGSNPLPGVVARKTTPREVKQEQRALKAAKDAAKAAAKATAEEKVQAAALLEAKKKMLANQKPRRSEKNLQHPMRHCSRSHGHSARM